MTYRDILSSMRSYYLVYYYRKMSLERQFEEEHIDPKVARRMVSEPAKSTTGYDISRLMPTSDEHGNPGDMESDFDELRRLSRDKTDSKWKGFKSYMGVGTDSTASTTDEQWKKCFKRQYDVKRNADDRNYCAQKGRVYDNFIKCRQSKAGNEGVEDIVTIPDNVQQSGDPGKQKMFKREYTKVLENLKNNENFTAE